MSVLSLRLSNNFDSYISGEVTIHPSAVLAPGVILQAAVNSKIIIGPGVCIGMGAILQVHEGTLEVEAGANLGAGFLMVGKGKIGANACIGSATTVFNYSVEPGQVIAPGSILGDTSRQIAQTMQPEPSTNNQTPTSATPQKEKENGLGEVKEKVTSSTNFSASAFVDFKQNKSISYFKSPATPESQSPPVEEPTNDADSTLQEAPQESTEHDSDPNQPTTESSNGFGTQIYGQGSIHRLLTTLFPHRQSLNDPNSDD
ncbi:MULTISPECIES: transferase [Nostoc]|uniref:Transferase n=2 Tax=Nostoc TaxID=1177 RepID=A0ABR8I3J9_9NOSO|nr:MULTISPECIES: transferase [Nostoc]MBD2559560.1 transferase [Nostoc linckia FACHB-391]MBD2645486.1 transferase [Nostoc foliaceum FACHB-393]MBG1243888.1 transferase [Nostoc sp. NZL]